MKVFIPTRGRIHQQFTRRHLKPIPNLIMVVPECEQYNWSEPKIVVPDEYRFSDIRQAILHSDVGDDHHVVIDDDLYFYERYDGVRLRRLEDATPMWDAIQKHLDDGYVHGAISPREGNNRQEGDTHENTRAMRCHFYDAAILRGEGIDYRDVLCRQDFHVTLLLLELGYPNIVDFRWAHNQPGSDVAGGCSRYRDEAMLAAEAEKLASLHPPGIVKVVEKETKTSWGGGTRTDVMIQWKKAFCLRESERRCV